MPFIVRFALAGLLLVGSMAAAPSPWTQMKMGMTAEATATLLGPPMLQTKGRGLETWFYEHGAEVLLRGKVVGWTLPALALAPGKESRGTPLADGSRVSKRPSASDDSATTRHLAPIRAAGSWVPGGRSCALRRPHDL